MVRKQVFITAEQNARLKLLAAQTGKAEGELVRTGLEKVLVEQEANEGAWKAELMKLAGMWEGRDDLDEQFAERRKRRGERRDRMNELMKRGRGSRGRRSSTHACWSNSFARPKSQWIS